MTITISVSLYVLYILFVHGLCSILGYLCMRKLFGLHKWEIEDYFWAVLLNATGSWVVLIPVFLIISTITFVYRLFFKKKH